MARTVEQTKERAREAALAEFAEHGLDGTTMERIARRAGVNKERIYRYFGDKRALFGAVVHEQLVAVADAVPLEVGSVDDLAAFAGATFDYLLEHRDLARLTLWEGLSDDGAIDLEAERTEAYRRKVQTIRAAQEAGALSAGLPPAQLLFLVLGMASWSLAAPQTLRMLEAAANDGGSLPGRREAVVEAVRRMAAP